MTGKRKAKVKTRIEKALEPYGDHLDDWLCDEKCTVTPRQRGVLLDFLETGDHARSMEKLEHPRTKILSIYNNGVSKLSGAKSLNLFKIWLVHQLFIKAGVLEKGYKQVPFTTPCETIVMHYSVFITLFEQMLKRPLTKVSEHDYDTIRMLRDLDSKKYEDLARSGLLIQLRIVTDGKEILRAEK